MATSSFVVGDNKKPTIEKDSNATLDYTVDWTDWMTPGDQIASLTVVVTEESLLEVEAQGFQSILAVEEDLEADPVVAGVAAKHTTTSFLSGGLPGKTVSATHRIVTTGTDVGGEPRTDDRTLYFKIVEK